MRSIQSEPSRMELTARLLVLGGLALLLVTSALHGWVRAEATPLSHQLYRIGYSNNDSVRVARYHTTHTPPTRLI